MESDEPEIEVIRKMAAQAISECTDYDLLDLIYKLLITSTNEIGRA